MAKKLKNMTGIKLFAHILSFREITKNSYIIKIEVVSFGEKGIVPNVDFSIKAGSEIKIRTTNSNGFFQGDEFFESKEIIKEIELLDINKRTISKYDLPFYTSNETQELLNNFKKELKEKDEIIKNSKKIENKIEKELETKIEVIKKEYQEKINYLKLDEISFEKALIGNVKYSTIQIGNKVWMNDDLMIPLNDGTIIDDHTFYYKNSALSEINDKLKSNNQGWRLPLIDDFETFINFFVNDKNNKLNLNNSFFIYNDYKGSIKIDLKKHFFWYVTSYSKGRYNDKIFAEPSLFSLDNKNKEFHNYPNDHHRIKVDDKTKIFDKYNHEVELTIYGCYARIRLVKDI